jgi:hypothetical protein
LPTGASDAVSGGSGGKFDSDCHDAVAAAADGVEIATVAAAGIGGKAGNGGGNRGINEPSGAITNVLAFGPGAVRNGGGNDGIAGDGGGGCDTGNPET